MASAVIPIPKPLNVGAENKSVNYDLFKQTWTNYELATGLKSSSNEQRLATLLSVIGTEALIVYNAFTWSPNEVKTVESTLAKFEVYCKPKRNITYERYLFLSRKQQKNESVDDYIVALRNLIVNCDYEQLTDSILRDAIVLGIKCDRLRESLLREQDLSLDKCVNIARTSERARKHFVMFSSEKYDDEPMEVNKVSPKVEKRINCKYCGYAHQLIKEKCPARGKKCYKCGGMNHFISKCMKKVESEKPEDVKMVAEEIEDEEFIIE